MTTKIIFLKSHSGIFNFWSRDLSSKSQTNYNKHDDIVTTDYNIYNMTSYYALQECRWRFLQLSEVGQGERSRRVWFRVILCPRVRGPGRGQGSRVETWGWRYSGYRWEQGTVILKLSYGTHIMALFSRFTSFFLPYPSFRLPQFSLFTCISCISLRWPVKSAKVNFQIIVVSAKGKYLFMLRFGAQSPDKKPK